MAELPLLEISTYFLLWIGSICYSLYSFANVSNDFVQHNDGYLDPGWVLLSRKKDNTDYEWNVMKFIIFSTYPWIIVQISLSEIMRRTNCATIKVQKYKVPCLQIFQILTSFSFILYKFGLSPFLISISQPIAYIIIMSFLSGFKQILISSCLVLYQLENIKEGSIFDSFFKLSDYGSLHGYAIVTSIFWMFLKCTSYSLDFQNKKIKNLDVIDFLSYCFYLPTFYSGPYILYDDYKKGLDNNKTNLQEKLFKLFLNVIRMLFWFIFIEYALHYFYVNEVGAYPEFIETLGRWELYGYGYAMSHFFYLKYVVAYGLSTTIARFDNVSAPDYPKCIARIYLYSEMWKTFDVGLYQFLKRYIYVPSIKSKYFLQNKYVSSFLCFAFVYVWHGTAAYIFIWVVLNYIGIVIETLSKEIDKRFSLFNSWRPQWKRRIFCILAAPLLAMSAVSNFYFFSTITVGNIFILKLFTAPFSTNIILIVLLYCCCQICTELEMLGI